MNLTDADFGHMRHALGRPKTAADIATAYRNYFCTWKGSSEAARFMETGCWRLARPDFNDGRDEIYAVNEAGKAALVEWMKRRVAA